jgi:hypothetical protein
MAPPTDNETPTSSSPAPAEADLELPALPKRHGTTRRRPAGISMITSRRPRAEGAGSIFGYRPGFIVRNSWGLGWGDKGFDMPRSHTRRRHLRRRSAGIGDDASVGYRAAGSLHAPL